MNKAEELKLKLIKAFVSGEPMSNKDFCDTLEQYAQQERKKIALETYIQCITNQITDRKGFDEWYTNHQNQQ
jgi:hypothetical protein